MHDSINSINSISKHIDETVNDQTLTTKGKLTLLNALERRLEKLLGRVKSAKSDIEGKED